ncbi:LysE/ArgO family amino acid transporter [Frigoribacterium salinisoli]
MTFSTLLGPLLLGFGNSIALIVAIGAQNAFLLRVGIEGRRSVVVPVVIFCAVSDAVLITLGVLGVGALLDIAPGALHVMRLGGAAFLLAYAVFAAKRAIRPRTSGLEPADVEPLGADGTAPASDLATGTALAAEAGRAVEASPGSLVVEPGTAGGTTAPTTGTVTLERPRPRPRASGTATGLTTRAALLTVAAFTWLNPHAYLDTVVLLGSIGNQQGPDDRWWWVLGAVLASITWFSAVGFGARLLRPLFAKPGAWRVLDAFVAVVMLTLGLKLLLGG